MVGWMPRLAHWSTLMAIAKRLFAGAVAGAAHRRGAERIEPDGDAHIGFGRADAIDRIEADPAETGHMGLGPGVTAAVRLGAAAHR